MEIPMRFCITESMCDVSHYLPLVQAAEEAGFDTFSLGDSIIYPEVAVGKYPYTESGDRSFLDGVPFPDPFQMIAAMGTITKRIRLMTGVLKLPVRQPVLVAKQVNSLAVLTHERFVLGIGLSPWLEDFEASGESWQTRGARTSEMIEIIRGLATGEYYEFHGKYYDFQRLKQCPVPKKCPPIIYGGHTLAAYRRAARLCDGFSFIGVGMEELAREIGTLRGLLKEYGREAEPFTLYAGIADAQNLDDFRRVEELGVEAVFLGYRDIYQPDSMPLAQKLDAIKQLGDNVIAKY